ncbi:MAG: ABC transporter permease [bacterium]
MNLSSELAKTLAFTFRNITTVRRNVFQIAEIFYWPFITLLSIGFMLAFLKPGGRDTAVVMSGVVALSVLQTCQLDVAYVLLFDMWSKCLKHTLVAPIGRRHYLIGSWIVGIFRGTATFLILAFFIRWVFHFDIFKAGIEATVRFWAGLMVSGLIIGMLTTVSLYTFGWRAEIVPWSIVSVLLLICGIYYPIEVLPAYMHQISRLVPLTLFLEDYRASFGMPSFPGAAERGFVLSGIYFGITYGLLILAERRAKRTGLFLKMSE